MLRAGLLVTLFATALPAADHPLVNAKDGSGVFGYKDTPVQPWSGYPVHDPDRPAPPRVQPGRVVAAPPSDALVLFDGKDLSAFKATKWKLGKGYVEATDGDLATREDFEDCQLHLEWLTPPPAGDVMNRGNNGVLLMGIFEIQVFDSYNTKIYPDGQAASVYGQTPPLVNATLPPGEWQSFDIVFLAPRFRDGKLERNPRVTVFHNGVLVQHDQEIYGTVKHRELPGEIPPGMTKGPVVLNGHHCPVRFRNLWVRRL